MSKRSVSTDALGTLGTIIGPDEKRDAIHLAVLPVVAGVSLRPGEGVSCSDGIAVPDADGLGIVDPFLLAPVRAGQRFWMVLRPRLVTSLRHVWSHPEFPDEGTVQATDAGAMGAAYAELQSIARDLRVTAEELIDGANAFLDRGDWMIGGSAFEGERASDAFWNAFEAYTGRVVPEANRENFFGCSC